jgi:hypothetical protein
MILQAPANFERTPRRFFRTVEENQGHPITGRHPDEFAACFRRSKTLGVPYDPVQFL